MDALQNQATQKRCAMQAGVTLIEIVVTLLVLTIGMLGLVTSQTISLKLSHESYLRTQADILSQDLIARVNSNPNKVYSINSKLTALPTNCYTANCSATQLRHHDLYHWQQQVYKMLPNVKQAKVHYNTNQNIYTLTLMWPDRYQINTSTASTEHNYQFRVNP